MRAPAGRRRLLSSLRTRVLAAMVLTAAVTLGVAALAVLSPLEARLRADGMRSVRAAITAWMPERGDIEIKPDGEINHTDLRGAALDLSHRAGAEVNVLGISKLEAIYAPKVNDLNVPDYFRQARRARASGTQVRTTTANSLVVAQPVRLGGPGGRRYVLIVVKHLEYVALAVKVVQNAFIVAAAVGLGTALLLGIGLASTMLRRLERLRDATRELERHGPEAPLPRAVGHDEISELTDAFAGMQSQLRRQEAARRSFVATASHELRTPLASLDGMLELLDEDLQSETVDLPDAREQIGNAREQARRLTQLARDLLDLSRLDADVKLHSEPLELGELARAVAAEFGQPASEHGVKLVVPEPATQCWAHANPGSVARIVRILIDNALGFAPPGSAVEVIASGDEGECSILVADSGPGVPPAERETIFERFTRGSDTSGRGGFGLGLAIGRELAERMGGSLELLDREDAQNALADEGPPQQDDPAQDGGEEASGPDGRSGARFILRLPAGPMLPGHERIARQ